MKVDKKNDIKLNFNFEAMFLPAGVNAGSSPESSSDHYLDLYAALAPKPQNIFVVRVSGESMIDEGIYDGDILIVDKEEEPKDGKVVIAALNGELLVKTYKNMEGKIYLFSANKRFVPIEIFPDWDFKIQGVVKHVIHSL